MYPLYGCLHCPALCTLTLFLTRDVRPRRNAEVRRHHSPASRPAQPLQPSPRSLLDSSGCRGRTARAHTVGHASPSPSQRRSRRHGSGTSDRRCLVDELLAAVRLGSAALNLCEQPAQLDAQPRAEHCWRRWAHQLDEAVQVRVGREAGQGAQRAAGAVAGAARSATKGARNAGRHLPHALLARRSHVSLVLHFPPRLDQAPSGLLRCQILTFQAADYTGIATRPYPATHCTSPVVSSSTSPPHFTRIGGHSLRTAVHRCQNTYRRSGSSHMAQIAASRSTRRRSSRRSTSASPPSLFRMLSSPKPRPPLLPTRSLSCESIAHIPRQSSSSATRSTATVSSSSASSFAETSPSRTTTTSASTRRARTRPT